MGVMAPDYLTKNSPDGATTKPMGTGPYKIAEWIKGQHLLLTANEEYWGDPKPTIKEVEFLPRAESGVRLTALKAGEAHLISNVTPEDAGTLPKEQVIAAASTETMYIRPNANRPITSDVRVRQAMQYALDRATIVKEIMGGYGSVPNGQLYNFVDVSDSILNMKDYPYDPDKAKALIKEAGAEGKTVSINGESANRWLKDREVQQVVASMLEKVGLKVDLQLREVGEWNRIGFEVQNPPVDIHFSSGNDQVDPDRILVTYGRTGGRLSTYSNPELDKLIDASRAEAGPEQAGRPPAPNRRGESGPGGGGANCPADERLRGEPEAQVQAPGKRAATGQFHDPDQGKLHATWPLHAVTEARPASIGLSAGDSSVVQRRLRPTSIRALPLSARPTQATNPSLS